MAKEMPPKSFPIDDEGNKICAKCNTRSGCTRPVMDQHNSNLRSELFEVEKLYTYDNMAAWIENALNNQRCIWGVHKAISKDDSVQFKEWFNRPENNGFKPYDSTFVLSIVKELLTELYTKSYKNDKAVKGSGLKLTKKQKNELIYHINAVERAYMDMDGAQVFHFMVDCDRDNPRCNERREFDGDNHQHPYELEGTEIDKETYAEVADLRRKCIDMGLDAKTGPQRDLDKTMSILRKRIDEHANKKSLATASRKKNEERSDIIKDNKSTVKNVAGDQLSKHMGNACSANDIAKVLSLINRGANANVETPRGMRPLLVVIVNNGNPDQISKVIKGGAYINACNRLGLTALMLACRLRDTRLVHLLLQNGADEVASEGRLGQGRTALHYCALHSAEDEARAMYDYTKDGEDDDPMRMVRFLDFQDKNGDTPLMVAARNRNGLMCFNLLKLGADPKIVNSKKQSAAYIAREYSYGALADFLDTKMASGVASIETFSDLQFEKVQRFGGLKLMELIQQYCNKILKLLQGRNNVTILMCPSRIQEFADMYGDHEKHQLVNRYFFFILMQQPNNADTTAMIDAMKKIVQDIVKVVREGNVYPSVEALEKPLPWTALMCAATLNDARSMRLICHEGADPNYQNRHGMTALMLAAQLNNIEAICELLLLGSDINLVDNEGYNAYAYSISLPYAKPLQRSSSNVITDGDNDVTKRYTADEVLKMAVTLTPVEIKVRVKANLKKCTAVEIKREMDRLKLLEKNGLSKVKTEDDLHHNVASSHWRIDPEASLTLFGEDCYGDSDKKMSVQDAVKKLKEHDKKKGQKPRCPICTLALPCKHFKKESQANEYARKKEREDLIAVEKKKAMKRKDEEDEDEDEEDNNKHSYKERSNALYEKEDNDVSENENLRMQLEIEKERAQVLADRLEKEENESDGLNNLPPRTPVKVKLRRQLHEEQQKSKELANKLEEKKNARENEKKKNSTAKDYAESAKKGSSKHPHTPVTSKLLKELEDEKQRAIDLAEELDRVKSGDQAPKTPEHRAKVRKELEDEKNRTKSLENALDKTKKRIKDNSPAKKSQKKDSSKKKKSKGKANKYAIDSDEDEDKDNDDDRNEDDEEEVTMGSKNKASKLRKKVEEERRKKEEELRRKEEKKKAAEKARKEEEKRKKKEEAENKKLRELERKKKEAEKARLKEEARKRKEKEDRQRRKEEEQARKLAKQAKEKADKLKAEQKAQDAKIKKEREKMKVKLLELQARLNKKEIDDTKKHKKSRDKKSMEKSAQEYRRMKKEMEAISNKLNKTSRRANDAENRLEEMVQLMSIKKEIEDHNSKIAEATNRKSTLAKKLLNHMGDAVLYSEAGFSEDAQQYMNRSGHSPEKESKKSKNKHRDDDSDDDDRHYKKSSKKAKLLEVISHSKKHKISEKSKLKVSKKKKYETSDEESVSSSSESEISSSDEESGSDTETSIEDVGLQIDESDSASDSDSNSDLESVSDLETSASGNETEASGYYDSDGSRPVSRSIIKRDTGEKKYKAKKRVLKFNINNKILTNLPKGEKKIKVSTYEAALKRPVTAETDASSVSEDESDDSSSEEESSSGSEVESETEGEETEVDSDEQSEIEEESEEEEDHKKLSRKNRGKMAKWMNKL